jgi:uncharacterized protein (DUF4415 family)
VSVFSDDLAITIPDERFDEERFVTIGLDGFGRVFSGGLYPTRRSDSDYLSTQSNKTGTAAIRGGIVMEAEYDFSQGKRGAIDPAPSGKTRITIRLDDEVLAWFRQQVHSTGGGNYQTLINEALRQHIRASREPLEETLRKVVREELERIER